MFRTGRIGWKIFWGYFAILAVAFFVLGGSFYLLVRLHAVREARSTLLGEARGVAEILSRTALEGGQVRQVLSSRLALKFLGRFLEGDYVVLDREGHVVFSSRREGTQLGGSFAGGLTREAVRACLERGRELFLAPREFALAVCPVKSGDGVRGAVVVMAPMRDLRSLTRQTLVLLGQSFAVAAVVAILLSSVVARGIAGPITILKEQTARIARRQFAGKLEIRTGDEIQELGESFRRMAERLAEYDSAQRRFLQNASHELKTPLASIQGYVEGVRDGVLREEEATGGLDIVIKECGRLREIVDEIVYLTRLESVEESYDFTELDVREVVGEAIDVVGGMARDRGVRVQGGGWPAAVVRADGDKLLRVFVNILSNCVRHAASTVAVSVERAPGQVRVGFRDDGAGFTPDDLNHLFERFYRGRQGDTGLGMAIAKSIVDRHGGSIAAGNHPEGGARLVVSLPRAGRREGLAAGEGN